MTTKIPQQRWHIASESPEQIAEFVQVTGLSPLLAQVLIQRDIKTPEQARFYINPETEKLPLPLEEFPDLKKSVDLLEEAISEGEKIAICGDYDVDGMTSTALLLRALKSFGANVGYAIPNRMKDGYGINERIVTEFAEQGVGLILTVDNGISAYDPIALAVDLGIGVIITDHHEVPEKVPPADAILNPKLIPENSPYRGLAGVGVAYILAVTTGQRLGALRGLTNTLLELFTLGTIADLAPLTGVNRRWLKRGLRRLAKSELAGVQALMELSGVKDKKKPVKPDAIGFRLGPRINAVGRINDPEIVIELLTTDDEDIALERAMQCEATNRKRQNLCEQIELEAIQQIKEEQIDYKKDRVLVIFGETWHHGVIGIVASRLVERYGVPVFICTSEDDKKMIRGSARGIPEFNVFEALNYCQDLLGKFGGHKAAGGFSFAAENFPDFQRKLSEFACQCLQIEHLKPLVNVDALANLDCVTAHFYEQIESLQPWGIGNATPVFWTPNVRLLDQQTLRGNHLKLTLGQKIKGKMYQIKAIAWRWGEYYPLPKTLDIAYKLKENTYNGATNIELEIVGVRPATQTEEEVQENSQNGTIKPEISKKNDIKKAKFVYKKRSFNCSFWISLNELRIKNDRGEVLVLNLGAKTALLGKTRDTAKELDLSHPYLAELVAAARDALKMSENKQSNVG